MSEWQFGLIFLDVSYFKIQGDIFFLADELIPLYK